MATRRPKLRKPNECAVELAIAAIEGRPNPLDDPEMVKVHPDRTSLDLPGQGSPVTGAARSDAHGFRSSTDACPRCGFPLNERRT